jgi:hypothetical protein
MRARAAFSTIHLALPALALMWSGIADRVVEPKHFVLHSLSHGLLSGRRSSKIQIVRRHCQFAAATTIVLCILYTDGDRKPAPVISNHRRLPRLR